MQFKPVSTKTKFTKSQIIGEYNKLLSAHDDFKAQNRRLNNSNLKAWRQLEEARNNLHAVSRFNSILGFWLLCVTVWALASTIAVMVL